MSEGSEMRDFAAVFYDLFLQPLPGGWKLRERFARLAKPLVPREVYESKKKLNLGSSNRRLPDYINLDLVTEYKPDVVSDARRLCFADETFDLVRASHILEHFTYEECAQVLAEWRRVLRPRGYLVVCCPDYVRLSWRAILRHDGFDPLSKGYHPSRHGGWISGLFALDLPPELRHKTVFTERSLRHLLHQADFLVLGRQVSQVEHPYTLGILDDSYDVCSLNLTARKP